MTFIASADVPLRIYSLNVGCPLGVANLTLCFGPILVIRHPDLNMTLIGYPRDVVCPLGRDELIILSTLHLVNT